MDLLQQLKDMPDEEFVRIAMDGAKGMNRQQKRQLEREITEEAKTLRTLTAKQMQFMHRYANAKAREKSEEQVLKYITLVDTCLTAYFYLKYENMTPDEVLKETTLINDMLIEYRDMLNDLIKENRGNEDMAGKALEKIAKEVQVKCVDLVNEGKNQKDALEILQFEFPTMKKALLVNAYKHTKAKLKAEQVEKEATPKQLTELDNLQEEKAIEAAVEYIFEEPKNKVKKVEEPKAEVKEVKVTPAEVKVEEVKEKVKMNKGLKVKTKKVIATVEGEFGEYLFEDGVVTVEDMKFTNMDEVNEFEKVELNKIYARLNELKAVMGGEF